MISIEFLILILISIALLTLALWVIFLHLRLYHLTRGTTQESLEQIFTQTLAQVDILTTQTQLLEASSVRRDKEFMNSIQGVGFLRFNPFGDTSGQQSFACALIDQHNNGIIFSSLYAREKMRIFAKSIHHGISDQELSNEEKEALTQAQQRLTLK